jgi:hypothetical protein
MIRIVHVDRSAGDFGGTVILFKREILDEWMTLTDSVIVQTFDFTRVRLSSFGGWSNAADPKHTVDGDLMYRSVLELGRASYARGVQIVRSDMKKEALFDRIGWSPTKKEEDIAHDLLGTVAVRPHRLDLLGRFNQRLDAGRGVALVRVLHRDADDSPQSRDRPPARLYEPGVCGRPSSS